MEALITLFHTFPPEVMMALNYGAAIALLYVFFKFFKKEGLLTFIILAIVLANMEVLKATQLSCMENPMALGTILFTCTYLATDILVEHFGPGAGKKAIYMSFAAVIMVTILMTITVGMRPIQCAPSDDLFPFLKAHYALETLFTPTPAILCASLISYVTTQYMDVRIFNFLKNRWHRKYLGLRTLIATLISTFFDSVIFSILAWKIFFALPISWTGLWHTYIWSAYILRILISIANVPIIYLFRRKDPVAVS